MPEGGAGSRAGSGQQRAVERRAAIVEGAVAILLRDGTGSVTHRAVAAEAQVPLASIRYYFETREALLLACIDHLDRERSDEARRALVDAGALSREGARLSAPDVALLLLRVYDGPDTSDDALRGSVGWVLDCARESPALSTRLAQMRAALDLQVRELLDLVGRASVDTGTVGAVVDGTVFTACVERRAGIADRVVAELARVLDPPG